MTESTAIDVCIPTFKRPHILANLLDSLGVQNLDGLTMRIVVIDNDQRQTARPVVDAFRRRCDFEVVYDVEPRQNIALARNRALRHVRADYFAFADDDETVSPLWLRSLLDCLLTHRADIVFGPVLSTLPDGAPAWAEMFFNRPPRKTGDLLQTGATNNVMLRRAVIAEKEARFNPAFGLTGGEDTDFFHRAYLSGKRLVWCQDALIVEPVPASRLSLQWVRRRGFRGGQNFTRVFVDRYPSHKKVLWFVKKITQLAGGLMLAPIFRLVSYPRYVTLTVRIAAVSGQLSYCFSGEDFEEYSVRNYK